MELLGLGWFSRREIVMSLMNTFFSPEVGEANFLETTYPLTDDLFGDDSIAWHSDDEAMAVV